MNAQYRLVREGLAIRHLRLVMGNSMGGMHAWIWGVKYPDAMDALMPMASQPTEMASRNWMMRRLMIEVIRSDPDYHNGNYTTQPRSMKLASVFYSIATNGGTLAYQSSRRPARRPISWLTIAWPRRCADANDFIYAWESSRDYDPSAELERIAAALLVINAADDERNPLETGTYGEPLKRVKHGRLHLIPTSDECAAMVPPAWRDF